MSFNRIQNYKFNVSFTSDFIANNQMNSMLFLKDKNGNIIKNNNNFIVFENSSFLLKMFSNNIEISGKIVLEKSLKHLTENLLIKNTFELINKILFKKENLFFLIEIKQKVVDTLIRKFKIESLNDIKINDDNFYKSKTLIGQIINTKNGLNLIKGTGGINVEIKEKNNFKYYTIDYSAYATTSIEKSSYLTKIYELGVSTDQSDQYINASIPDSPSQYSLTSQYSTENIKYFDNTFTSKKRKTTKFTINQNFKSWNVGKSVIYIDTISINPPNNLGGPTDFYQMQIDLTGRTWQIGEEITFYLNLYPRSNVLNESYMILPFSNSIFYPQNIYPENVVPYTVAQSNSPTSLRKNMVYLWKSTVANAFNAFLLPTIGSISNGDYIIIKRDVTSIQPIKIIFSGLNNATNTDFKNYSTTIAFQYNSTTSKWEEVTSNLTNFINERTGYFYSYQYVITFPFNHILFTDNSLSTISSYFSLKNVIDTSSCSTNYDQTRSGGTNNTIGNVLPQNLKYFKNSICFDSSLDGASFTLRFLGFSDPSRPGIGLWQIK